MHDSRGDVSLVTLKNGDVLAAGGWTNHCNTYTELYDPATGQWSETGQLGWVRTGANTALLLPDGRVFLYAGGRAEIYDPATGTWSDDGLVDPAYSNDQSVALLSGGDVLIAGGRYYTSSGTYITSSVNIWDPIRRTLAPAAPLHHAREGASATILPDGDVLVAGGEAPNANPFTTTELLSSTEIYNPASNAWTDGPSMSVVRGHPTGTLLQQSNEVVLAGGSSGVTDVFNATTHTMRRVADLSQPWSGFAATALADGRLMAMGGDGPGAFASTQIFDPHTDQWSMGPSMSIPRCAEGATLLLDGQVLVAGGYNYDYTTYPGQYPTYGPISTSEVISPS